jgi:hypothetical protein
MWYGLTDQGSEESVCVVLQGREASLVCLQALEYPSSTSLSNNFGSMDVKKQMP